MAGVDVDTLTMEQYLALSRENQAPDVVKPEIRGNVNFEVKSQFMRELREDTFSKNNDKDTHDHIDRQWVDRLAPGTINTLDLLKKAFIQRTMSRNIKSSSSKDGLAALVGCQIYEGPYLDKDCPLNEEVKHFEEGRILQISQEKSQNRAKTNTRTDRVHKSRKFSSKWTTKVNNGQTLVNNKSTKVNLED
ncbi:hypothetical protein Tco_1252693 [Tanacetum coccineum]